ncbi:hypothetical protein ACTUSQ_01215 [Pantoea ananatis]|uniref:hypothetical protein n=1 Tax=Pantoea ananas TaxID=553 RepID=UPI003FA473D9
MRERPILLNAEMVRAVLEGRKTQTRRIIQSPAKNIQATGQKVIDYREPVDKWYGDHVFSMRNQSGTWCDYTKEQFLAKCPFGAVGDRLWVRERARVVHRFGDMASIKYEADGYLAAVPMPERIKPVPVGRCLSNGCYREASRITLEITGVRVERLASISNEDSAKEGYPANPEPYGGQLDQWLWFRQLWDGLYPEQSFKVNPWVWVIEFKRVEVNA